MAYLLLACSITLCVVFGISAANKLGKTGFNDFAGSAGPLKVLPRAFRRPAARASVVAEGALTVLLLISAVATVNAALVPVAAIAHAGAAVLLLAFTVAIVLSLHRGDRQPCRCFGAKATPLGPAHVVRNVLLLVVAFCGLVAAVSGGPSVEAAGATVAAVAGLVVGLLVTRFDDLADLFSTPETSAGDR